MKTYLAGIAVAALGIVPAAALAEYPERPITMIVAYSAGGGTDVAARTLVPYLEKYLGNEVSISVSNKPGAGGEVGFTALAHSKADGYTIGFINAPNVLTIPIQRKARYTLDDIQPVANVIYDPGAFGVLPDAGIGTLDELIEYARENPGEVTYGTAGAGSDDHLAVLSLEREHGVQMRHVPFDGNADVRAALLGGHIKMASMNVSEMVSDSQEGTLVVLGQMASERWEGAPDIPTFQEQGYDIVMGANRSLGAPAGIPAEALEKLSAATEQAMNDPEFRAAAAEQDLPLFYMNAKAFTKSMQDLSAEYQSLWDAQPWIEQ
ncbi:tripartite tricarboxylate transporter substrate binding protein [Roseivivax sp. CAU 1761]